MSRRKRSRPSAPMTAAERAAKAAAQAERDEEQARVMAEREAELARLKSMSDVAVTVAPGKVIVAAERRDVFGQLFHAVKPALSQDEYNAVRRFERDLAASLGVADKGGGAGRVDQSLEVPAALKILMAASDRVGAVLNKLGVYFSGLLLGLILPPMLSRAQHWRQYVESYTGETSDRMQTGLVRQACAALARIYRDIDYGSKAA